MGSQENDVCSIVSEADNWVAPKMPDSVAYGYLILLGYNGEIGDLPIESIPSSSRTRRKQVSVFALDQRQEPNGVKKGPISVISTDAKEALAIRNPNRHVISYAFGKKQTVLVEYLPDPGKDMFQVGRSSDHLIDFTIVDTCYSSITECVTPFVQVRGNDKTVSSTISRYACRILCDRENPNKTYLYASGFDSMRNIVLGEKATKWTNENGDIDGLTTNGVLLLHPHFSLEDDNMDADCTKMYSWREVSVDGDIFELRSSRNSNCRGVVVPHETNMLQDGSLIDLCGATLMWRSSEGMTRSPSRADLYLAIDALNAGKPQCPVNLNTLIIPRKKNSGSPNRQPFVYLRCGHVQGKHDWGHLPVDGGKMLFKCPVCLRDSERVIQLTMGMEPAFHLNSGPLDHAFNPCGHVASFSTVRYWSRIPLPHGPNGFHPVCPFCTSLLAQEMPYVRLIFQDHCD